MGINELNELEDADMFFSVSKVPSVPNMSFTCRYYQLDDNKLVYENMKQCDIGETKALITVELSMIRVDTNIPALECKYKLQVEFYGITTENTEVYYGNQHKNGTSYNRHKIQYSGDNSLNYESIIFNTYAFHIPS